MRLLELPLAGAFLIEPELLADERGFFARVWDEDALQQQGLQTHLQQCSISFNKHRGTLRGLHFQAEPHPEHKLVRCTQGAIFDVVVDIRPESETYLHWHGVELSAENRATLYIPAGMAHGFQTLKDDSEVFYMITEHYYPALQQGFRYNDPAIAIAWPLPVSIISERDRNLPLVDCLIKA